MHHNRLLPGKFESVRLPEPPAAMMNPIHFMVCPAAIGQVLPAALVCCQWFIYQAAYAQAQAIARPSLPERDLLGVWN